MSENPKSEDPKSSEEAGSDEAANVSAEFYEKLQIESEDSFLLDEETSLPADPNLPENHECEDSCQHSSENFAQSVKGEAVPNSSKNEAIKDMPELSKFLDLYGEMPMVNPFLEDSFDIEVTSAVIVPEEVYESADLSKPTNIYKYMILKINMTLKYLSEAPDNNYRAAIDSLDEPRQKLEQFLDLNLELNELEKTKITTIQAVFELCQIVVYLCSGVYDIHIINYDKLKDILKAAIKESHYMAVVSLLISLFRVFKSVDCFRVQQIFTSIILEIVKNVRSQRSQEALERKINRHLSEADGILLLEITILELRLTLLEEIFALSALTFERGVNHFSNQDFDENVSDVLMEVVKKFEDQDGFLRIPSKILNFHQAEMISSVIKKVGQRLENSTKQKSTGINDWMESTAEKIETSNELGKIQRRNMYYEGFVFAQSAKFNLDPHTKYKLTKKAIEKWNNLSEIINMNERTDIYGRTMLSIEEAYKLVWKYAYDKYEEKNDEASYKKMKAMAIQRLNHGNKFIELLNRTNFRTITWGSLYDISMCYVKALRDIEKAKQIASLLVNILISTPSLFEKFMSETGLKCDPKIKKPRLIDLIVKSFYDKKEVKEAKK